METRLLAAEDEPQLEAFLASHRDSSMFLRSNARRGGLVFRGQPFQSTYAGAFQRGALVGVVAHAWNGMLQVQAPEHVASLARACAAWSERPVTGFAGPLHQVRLARNALGLQNAQTKLCADECLYTLELSNLIVPPSLSNGALVCQQPALQHRDLLLSWRLAYDIEVLGATDSPEQRERSAASLDRQMADGNAWIASDRGTPVSLSAFNATLPDMVQLGGIYTPPTLRCRGFARVAVAGSLLSAIERGASRAVLFTNSPSAMRSYEALGFAHTGDFSLILLR